MDSARRRLAELPGAEQALDTQLAASTAAVDAAKAVLAESHTALRQLEKDVAAVDSRMAKFESHKSAVKTNHEYQALNHEIATAKVEKDGLEERILVLMEEADKLSAVLKAAETVRATTKRDTDKTRAALVAERSAHDAAIARLTGERDAQARTVDAKPLALYEQLFKGRRGVGIAGIVDDRCAGCHVRLRPHLTQQVRRNDSIVQCESCQRILYYIAPPPKGEESTPASPSA
jgi:hypothetical protein